MYIGVHGTQEKDFVRSVEWEPEEQGHFTVITSDDFASLEGYNRFSLSQFDRMLGEYVLTIQWDGFVIDAPKLGANWWMFSQYDYIGAPWIDNKEFPVGNSGFSLRSHKLNRVLATMRHTPPLVDDMKICIEYRRELEKKYGIRFAPVAVAREFSYEHEFRQNTVGFHGQNSRAQVFHMERLYKYGIDKRELMRKRPTPCDIL